MNSSESVDGQALIIVSRDEQVAVERYAAAHGVSVDLVDERTFEPVTTVTLLLFGSVMAIGAVQHAVDEYRGGQVIDLRPGAPRREYRDPGVKYGLVVIYTADGNVRVEVKEPRGAFGRVIDAIRAATVELGKAGIDGVAKAVSAAVQADAVAIESSGGDGESSSDE